MLFAFNKPFNVLSQFTSDNDVYNLSKYIDISDIYVAGRLDKDSEGLLLLTNNGRLQHLISHPRHKLAKVYWVQVEGVPGESDLEILRTGVVLKDGPTLPAQAEMMPEPEVWNRDPPIRYRASIPTSWIKLTITEGRNRQVRRMTAAIGFPTLRLIRYAIGPWNLDNLSPGEYRRIPDNLIPAQIKEKLSADKPTGNKPKHAKSRTPAAHHRSRRSRKQG